MQFLSFATKATDRRERTRQWQAATRTTHVALEDDSEASIRGCDLGHLRLCAVTLGRHRVEYPRGAEQPGDGLIKFLLQEEGICSVEQDTGCVTLQTGQWCAIDKARPFAIQSSGPIRQFALVLPRHRIVALDGQGNRAQRPMNFLRGAGQVLHASAMSALATATSLGRADRIRLGEALIGLVNVAWHADPTLEKPTGKKGRRTAIFNYIEENLVDPDLNVAKIAADLGLAKRTLYKLFAEEPITISRLIWDRRLEHCRRALLDPQLEKASITEIALDRGFKDSQHFSRAFKQRFGLCPRDYRAAQFSLADNTAEPGLYS